MEVGGDRLGRRRGVVLRDLFKFLEGRSVRREARGRGDGERRGGPGDLVVASVRGRGI